MYQFSDGKNKQEKKAASPVFFSGRRPPAWAAYRQLQRYAYADLILPDKIETYATDGNTYLDERTVSPILGRRYYEMTKHLGNVQAILLEYRTSPVGAGAFVPLSAVTYGATLHILSEYTPRDVLVTICDEKDNYRFGFNGQEKVNEIAGLGNHNTALFWEYDTRTGVRANRDPKLNTWESPYAVFGSNPIWHNDVLGDTWTVGKDVNTQADVKNIPQYAKNSKYVNIGDDGKVSLDFGNLSDKKIDRLLKKDDGLALIKGLVDAKENYFYSTSSEFNSQGLKESRSQFVSSGGNPIIYDGVSNGYLNNEWKNTKPFTESSLQNGGAGIYYKNASTITYGADGSNNPVPTLLPKKGYDGQVSFAPGQLFIKAANYVQIRISTIRHELWENFYRTTHKKSYQDAHKAANNHANGTLPSNTFFMYFPPLKYTR
ncbi:MAG: hypothetical protein QM530_06290 [Phycisphaerales bacterium]|nr:hypothetical protein [Phycisphaerales bacterium]